MVQFGTQPDVFDAVAEPRRRAILDYLLSGERAVGEVVGRLGLGQPAVSKHLRVLRDAGLVTVRRDGRRRLYSADGRRLREMHEWTAMYERFWRSRLDAIKSHAEARTHDQSPRPHHKETD